MKSITSMASCVVLIFSVVTLAEEPGTSSNGELKTLFEQAEAKVFAGDHAAAVALYRQLLDQLPLSVQSQQAAFKAATCYEVLGRAREAVEMYERTVSIGRDLLKPRYYKIDGQKQIVAVGKPDSVKDRLQRSLKRQAILCQTLGDSAKGLEAIRYLAAFAPTAPAVAALIPLQLEFEGRPVAEAAEILRQQEQAADLCRQVQDVVSANGLEGRLALLDRVLSEYPDTAAAIRARADKAEILWITKRYNESRTLYEQIVDRIGQIAPDVNAAQEARYRLAWLGISVVTRTAQNRARDGQPVLPKQWQQITDACKVVMEFDPEPMHRAEANQVLIEAHLLEGRYDEVLSAANKFFQNYSGSKPARGGRLLPAIAWIRLFKGIAHERLLHLEEAKKEYGAILQLNATHPGALAVQPRVVQRAAQRLAMIEDD